MSHTPLQIKARDLRLECLRIAHETGKGHLGGVYSCLDVLISLYYGGVLSFDPKHPAWPDRDRFMLSKGHACLGLYVIFADLGIITADQLASFGNDGGLGGQLDTKVAGVDWNTGSLGHGLGVCAGMALSNKLDGKSQRVYTILGDAECSEGSIWEAISFAGEHRLDNLVAVIDRNRLSVLDVLKDEGMFKDMESVLQSWGWECFQVDGHSYPALIEAFGRAAASGQPTMILANTIKGKGVSFMENEAKWHHGALSPTDYVRARADLEASR